MKTSTVRGGIAKTISRRSSVTSTATAPQARRSWPTPRGSCSSCAAYVLHHALRTHTLAHTALATAQPSTVILTLFKVATQIKQYKDRILLHLPTSCPVKALLHRVTTLLTAIPVPALNTS